MVWVGQSNVYYLLHLILFFYSLFLLRMSVNSIFRLFLCRYPSIFRSQIFYSSPHYLNFAILGYKLLAFSATLNMFFMIDCHYLEDRLGDVLDLKVRIYFPSISLFYLYTPTIYNPFYSGLY